MSHHWFQRPGLVKVSSSIRTIFVIDAPNSKRLLFSDYYFNFCRRILINYELIYVETLKLEVSRKIAKTYQVARKSNYCWYEYWNKYTEIFYVSWGGQF